MIYRTLAIHGHAFNASGRVFVDNLIVHNGPFDSGILYKFSTEVFKHGSADVYIDIDYGQLFIETIKVTYPAIINKTTAGYYTLSQPIAQPMVETESKQFIKLPCRVGNQLHYKHLMFNGPQSWNLEIDNSLLIYPGINICDQFVDYRKAQWGYDAILFDPNSATDIASLISW